MMLTRCPHCATAFRVTPEQLRVRGGQVRCGHCQGVFNALDFLEEERPLPTHPVQPSAQVQPAPDAVPQHPPVSDTADLFAEPLAPEMGKAATAAALPEAAVMFAEAVAAWPDRQAEVPPAAALASPLSPDFLETPEQNTIAAEAAAEEMAGPVRKPVGPQNRHRPASETPDLPAALNAMNPDGGLAEMLWSGQQAPRWLYGMAVAVLSLLLFGQVLYQYRTPLASNSVVMAAFFKVLGVQVPLPRLTELVSIEASDLQADASRGQLVLGATLKNRASFAQDWPALELTLLDARDSVLSRRVLFPADYLPADAPPVLVARAELGIKLWLAVGQASASGYRLYVFYP